MTKEYTNGEVTVVWKPELCIHSRKCWQELGGVFNPRERPWVKMDGSDSNTIVAQIKRCPSGALQYYMNASKEQPVTTEPSVPSPATAEVKIEVTAGGPYLIHSGCTIVHPDGRVEAKTSVTALCRCGASKNKPYCDGSHVSVEM